MLGSLRVEPAGGVRFDATVDREDRGADGVEG